VTVDHLAFWAALTVIIAVVGRPPVAAPLQFFVARGDALERVAVLTAPRLSNLPQSKRSRR
jgi:hypothetical protein